MTWQMGMSVTTSGKREIEGQTGVGKEARWLSGVAEWSDPFYIPVNRHSSAGNGARFGVRGGWKTSAKRDGGH